VFTTDYNQLIEAAFRAAGLDLRVSVAEDEFRAHASQSPERDLVKLHGSIDRPESIVLTRDDDARSRRERAEMFRYLGSDLRYTKFLFVGFSLSDPNFGLLHDDGRLAFNGMLPASYVVQGAWIPSMTLQGACCSRLAPDGRQTVEGARRTLRFNIQA
jgi:hypothetical protein